MTLREEIINLSKNDITHFNRQKFYAHQQAEWEKKSGKPHYYEIWGERNNHIKKLRFKTEESAKKFYSSEEFKKMGFSSYASQPKLIISTPNQINKIKFQDNN